jgi:hypothetical protein
MFYISIFINFFYHEKFKVQINNTPPIISAPLLFLLSPDFEFFSKTKRIPPTQVLKKMFAKKFYSKFLLQQNLFYSNILLHTTFVL